MMTEQRTNKDKLAKLLAMEDIHVRHSSAAQTASFDVKNRVLTLPAWANLEDFIVDMMTGHEVGHALWTPFDGWKSALEQDIHKGILNIVEDARIEKKIKRKFNGLRKNFRIGYQELLDKDFFGLSKKKVKKCSFIDRINLYFKIGNLIDVPFSDDEKVLVKRRNEIVKKIKYSGRKRKYDCIIGVSGGTDSIYTLYMAKKDGLRPLAVHFDNGWNSEIAVKNIQNACEILDVDLRTHVANWEEFKDLQRSFLLASVPDAEAVSYTHLTLPTNREV